MNKSFNTYLFSYQHDGASWCFEIQAEDEEDAKARVAKLIYATYDGEVVAKLPAQFGGLWRLVTWARNSIQALRPAL